MSAIEVEHLTKRFGGVTAVRDVSFGIPAGLPRCPQPAAAAASTPAQIWSRSVSQVM